LWNSAFSSKQFVFVVGEGQTEFSVHAAVISKQSKALDVLINGPMAEASDGKAIFEDIQEDTFIRFCQFAYTGNYTTPEFTYKPAVEPLDISPSVALSHDASTTNRDDTRPIEEPPSLEPAIDIVPGPEPEDNDITGLEPKKSENPKKPSKSRLLRQSLDDKLYNIETIRTAFTARCEVRQNSSPTEDYTPVFLGHAQLYVFAEKWGIEDLKTLALFKLHKTLVSFTLYAARRPDIVELLQCAYSNDHTPDLVDAVDDLRSLVMLYTACEVENLIHCPEFLSLIGEGGQLAQDLVQMLMKRMGRLRVGISLKSRSRGDQGISVNL
jgi:hypothetical protein